MEDVDNQQTRVIFWTWVGVITIGLTVMIALPLAGR